MTTDDTILPVTCMSDGCDAPLTVTGWMPQTVSTSGRANETFILTDAPKRQHAQCEGEAGHKFERYEGFDWQPVRVDRSS